MDFFQAFLLGIIEGITEFLPVSSTAHLILSSHVLHISQTDFLSTFEIAIQSGAILAVALTFVRDILKKPTLLIPVGIAFIPTAVLGFLLHDTIRSLFVQEHVIAWALIIGGGVILLVEYFNIFRPQKSESKVTVLQALTIGTLQCLAFIPGVSRSLSTLYAGQLVGLSRVEALYFSFLLAVPTMGAATGLDLLKFSSNISSHEWVLLAAGFSMAFLTAWMSVRWFLTFVSHHSLVYFGWYRILIGFVALYFLS